MLGNSTVGKLCFGPKNIKKLIYKFINYQLEFHKSEFRNIIKSRRI